MEETFRVDSAWTRLLAALGVAALAFALLPLASASAQESGHPSGDTDGEATTASEHTPIEQERLSGATRFQTAADIATSGFDSADTVVIASGEKFPDALAGASLEGNLDAPVLLVPENLIEGSIPSEITDAIDELGATNAMFLGGEDDAVSDEVESYIVANTSVDDTDRVSGPTRYETAAAIAAQVQANNPTAGQASEELLAELDVETATVAFVATGEEFPDALAAGPGSYDGEHPVFLTPQDRLHGAADDGLEDFGADVIFLLGGTAAVDESVEDELEDQDYDVRRVGGANRFETATMLADLFIEDFGFDVDDVGLATGDPFADALASAPYLGSINAPLVLTPFNTTVDHTEDFFERHGCNIDVIHTFGGTAAVEEAVVDEYASIACPEAPADDLALSIEPETGTVGETATATATLTDEGDPVEGETVSFTTAHSADGAEVDPPEGEEDTDADGEAEFEFTTAETGTVTVTAEWDGLTAEAEIVFVEGLTDEAVENLQANDTGQDQDFTFTVADEPIGPGDTVTIDVSDADAGNADYTGASVNADDGQGDAVFAANTITYTGGATEDAVGDTITVTLQDVDAGGAETGLEAVFARDDHERTVTFDIE